MIEILKTDWRIIKHRDDPAFVLVGVAHGECFARWFVTPQILSMTERTATTETMMIDLGLKYPDHLPVPKEGQELLLKTIIENRLSKGLPAPDNYVAFAKDWVARHCGPLVSTSTTVN